MAARRKNPELETIFPTDEEYVSAIAAACGCKESKARKLAGAYYDGKGLECASATNLAQMGLTKNQAERLVASFRLGRHIAKRSHTSPGLRYQITDPSKLLAFVGEQMTQWQTESFVAVLLDARQRVINGMVIATGSLSEVSIHPRELFRDAVRMGAHSMIMVHNHPSGEPTPSPADYELTERMKQAGRLMGIPVLDHVVVAPGPDGRPQGHSFAAKGEL